MNDERQSRYRIRLHKFLKIPALIPYYHLSRSIKFGAGDAKLSTFQYQFRSREIVETIIK